MIIAVLVTISVLLLFAIPRVDQWGGR